MTKNIHDKKTAYRSRQTLLISAEMRKRKPSKMVKSYFKLQKRQIMMYFTYAFLTLSILHSQQVIMSTLAISIKPADFDRLIMPCYLGGSSSSSYSIGFSQQAQNPSSSNGMGSAALNGYSSQAGRSGLNGQGSNSNPSSNSFQPSYYAVDPGRGQARDGLSNLGQQVPRANTIDNFVALVSKIEASSPRLANDPDQLIKVLLGRFHMDNYYYDVRARTPISEQDRRAELTPALLNPMGLGQQQSQSPYMLSSDIFPEQLLDHDEKCSMYFMLSHFIDKASPSNPALSSIPITQLSGPLGGQRPPVLQAAGSGYPAQSANSAYSGGASGPRYPGPSPSFGSPVTNNMNGFGSGISNNPDPNSNSMYGMNVQQPSNQLNLNYNNMRNNGQYSGTISSNSRNMVPSIDSGARSRDDKQALEYGVVSIPNQENAALVLNRVLMGILAASSPPQTIRALASMIYPMQSISNTPKIDEEIDPLYAVTLADLWAISAIPKSGKPLPDIRLLGGNGRWNDTICPISFQLERSNSLRFTTAELIGGLDGFALGMFRRRLTSLNKRLRLSEMLKMYYSKTGFRPQFAEVGVCNRAAAISTQLDDLHRQTENYLRLYQLTLPISDAEIASAINKLDSFKDFARQAANQYAPPDICQDSSYNDPYPLNQQDQCEIAKADLSLVLDTSPQANIGFMNLVVAKLSQRLGLSRQGSSMSVLTNQQDTTGYAGAYSFNALVRNSTNNAEIGCALVHDTTRSFQGGAITDPTRLVEMFERALVNLDSEYLIRQSSGGIGSSSYKQSSYVSSLFGQADGGYMLGSGPKNTGGSKVIVWFNYGSQPRQASLSSYPTTWNAPSNSYTDQNQYRFYEAKKYLRENFRGASILAVTTSREEVKSFVYDEDKDIFTDVPEGSGSSSLTSGDYYPPQDSASIAAMSGPADQLVAKILQRMCTIPAVFQYPMCFRAPSENAASVGYISPGRKQYWMMSPKTFFASKSVRMSFKVEGGRLRICFGRMTDPDESALRNGQQYQTGSISFGGNQLPTTSTPSTGDYYTGLNYGICKDVVPGQEVDFVVEDPCYKKSIAECEPFYYVIREMSNPGEGDPNYMCKDEGCKRFDQARFVMSHSGVVCSSAISNLRANWILVLLSLVVSFSVSRTSISSLFQVKFTPRLSAALVLLTTIYLTVQQVHAQQAAPYDFGQGRSGQKRGNLAPSEVLAIILLIMVILAGLALTIGLCYYVSKRNSRGMTRIEQNDF